jgi:peptidoglycan/LPS O-acetylase OafA/YrhL
VTPPSKSRFGFIDAIRGIAACSVMLQHGLYQSGVLGGPPSVRLTGFIPDWLELGETGIVAFFIVSGFVIPLSIEKALNLKLFWAHRAVRIYPLYLMAFLITLLIEHGGDIHTIKAFITDTFAHLFFVQEYFHQENFVGGSWTLSLELIWYIAISSLAALSLHKKNVALVATSLILSFAADLVCTSGHHLPMGRLSMLLCCVLGLICYRRETGDISSKEFAILAAALICGIGLNLYLGFYLFPSPHPSATLQMATASWALAAIVFFVPFLTRRAAFWSHPVFSFLGRHSYSIYLLHPIVLQLATSAHLSGVPLLVTTIPVTMVLAVVTYRLIEAPPIRLGHKLTASAAAQPNSSNAILTKPASGLERRAFAQRIPTYSDNVEAERRLGHRLRA